MKIKIILSLFSILLISSCLKTRADLGERDQSQVYGKKNADNQLNAQAGRVSQLATKAQVSSDERDELIRGFNGRIESLENQIAILQKEKVEAANNTSESQKVQLLQEALTKMEAQIQKLESEAAASKATANYTVTGSDVNTLKNTAKGKSSEAKKNTAQVLGPYEIAQDHFAKKEWKKAILSYQKYVDENAKGKNVPDAKYKIGVCFQELGMKEEAMAFYEEVIANFGKTESGKKAKIRLAKIKK